MTLDEKVDKIAEDVAVIKRLVEGNGEEGICERVSRHERLINTIKGGWAATVLIFGIILALLKFL